MSFDGHMTSFILNVDRKIAESNTAKMSKMTKLCQAHMKDKEMREI